jgi:preprotein translocase subunit SecA
MEFKHEAFALFDEFSKNLRTEIAHDLFRFEIITREHPSIQQLLAQMQMETNRSFLSELEKPLPSQAQQEMQDEQSDAPEIEEQLHPVTVSPKVGRNDTCPCGSGKKYKKCCGAQQEEEQE